jgi:membrane protease YdiL (CAAX protease family)
LGILESSAAFALSHAHRLLFSTQNIEAILFQVAFTFLFGLYVGYIMSTTDSVWSCVAAHSICNFVGFPDFGCCIKQKRSMFLIYLLIFGGMLIQFAAWLYVILTLLYT